ncbi:MAG: EAL domain-containing protein [Burkholderiales bacterium]|nr:EAL domain-containing protein [Burkholderiales bacterium]
MDRRPPRPDKPSSDAARQLRAAAEALAGAAPAAALPAPTEIGHELQVHRIELEMQNEELRRTQAALEAARDRYLDLYDFAPVGYVTLDAEGLVSQANLTAATMLGTDRATLLGRRFVGRVAPADRDRWIRHAQALRERGEPRRVELALLGPDGQRFEAQLDGVRAVCDDRDGSQPVLRITITDIGERKRAEAELRLAATAFESQEGMMITDAQGVIARVNTAFTRITGYSAVEAVGRGARLLQSGRHDAGFYAQMWESLHRNGTWQGEIWNRRKSGEIYPQWLTITAVPDDDPAVVRYVGTMQDISLRKAREEEIARLAYYDPLTGLPNRRLMKDRLHQALAISARSQREGALMFIDLDRFKAINDTLGHAQGDVLLQRVAQRLTGCVRAGDTVARPGGDEFVVMLAADLSTAPVQAAGQAQLVGEKILAELHRPYLIGGHRWHGSASIGIALFGEHVITVDELLRRADQAMYQAKAAGRNTLRFYDAAIQQALQQRSALEAQLQAAIGHGEFMLHYQKVVGRDEHLLGAEALVRWQHPQRGLVAPNEFITLAEDAGLMPALGAWVLDAACAQLAAWAADPATAGLTLSVNVSAWQWREPHFVALVLDALARHGARADRLKLELTESQLIENIDGTVTMMQALKAHGIGLSLDDFGTGYASLDYLKRLPLDQMKVDRSFVQDAVTDARAQAIVHAIVDLGRNLGLTVVAEGVETRAQRDLLAGQGCHAFQGELYGRPVPAQDLYRAARRGVVA